MKTIYKYPLKTTDQQTITMHVGAEILKLKDQHGTPCLWVKLDTSNAVGDRTFLTFGTGHVLPENEMDYIGSYHLHNSELVFHVFEIL
ncbi:hypothetical protein CLU96_1260 [Chryseobacterium sp. 52]|uniref:DUF7352 domain-containing protein n=1 Tax=Chryseobacterium sp. 52 TaxID=2035213 RepID=UPI000C189C5D|nr:hypothetical protein [Chryseobacterium sp. 52]PIF44317.1 hypothetical protein CLU96_1260 [Chryseobacterium sp. 52]